METFKKKAFSWGLLGMAFWGLAAFGPLPELGTGRRESSEKIALALMENVFEVSSAWGQAVPGAPPPYRGRLVVNYSLLNSILLILLIPAVLGAVWFLNRLFEVRMKTLERRIAYLEYMFEELQAKQQEEVDGLRRQLLNLPGKAKADGSNKNLEKDTCVGKSTSPPEPNPFPKQ